MQARATLLIVQRNLVKIGVTAGALASIGAMMYLIVLVKLSDKDVSRLIDRQEALKASFVALQHSTSTKVDDLTDRVHRAEKDSALSKQMCAHLYEHNHRHE